MTTFDEREKAAEAVYVHEQDLAFRAHARRDRKLGLWAASLMGLKADEAATYADTLFASEIAAQGEAGLLARVLQDLKAAKVSISETAVRAKMAELLSVAMVEMKAGR